MFKWCIDDVHWFSQKPPWPPRFPKPCLFHAPQKVQSCFPVAAFFARTDAATTASKANWCLSPCQTWRQWSFNHLSGQIEHEQNKGWKNADVFLARKTIYMSLYYIWTGAMCLDWTSASNWNRIVIYIEQILDSKHRNCDPSGLYWNMKIYGRAIMKSTLVASFPQWIAPPCPNSSTTMICQVGALTCSIRKVLFSRKVTRHSWSRTCFFTKQQGSMGKCLINGGLNGILMGIFMGY